MLSHNRLPEHNAVGSESIEDLEKVKDQVDEEKAEELSIDEITKDDIIKRLEEQGIEHNPRDKKEVLFDLLVGE